MSSLARATALMSVGTVLSRLTGLARLVAITAALGVKETGLADPYNFGNTAPNILYEFLLGGILTSVFVPVFVELLEKEGRDRAWAIASAVINLSMVFLVGMSAVGIALAPLIARFYETDVAGQQEALTFLLRLFIPQIIFYALTAITAGLLNAHKRFGAPMYTPVLNNLAVIIVFLTFRQAYGSVTLGSVTNGQLLLIGGGTTLGVALMAVAQLPFLRGLGHYRLSFSIKHPSVRKVAGLSVYVIGYVMANQIGYLIVQRLARGQEGAYTAYVAAFTFFMLPHGLFAVSVITALLPTMSEHAANQRWGEFTERLTTGLSATFFLVFPAAVGYFVLAEPIVRLLLQNGVVTVESTELVAGVLRFFVLGLVPFSLFQLFLRAFYALQDTKTPFLINCAAVAVNIVINVIVFQFLGVAGLAAGHAAAYVFGAALQGRVLSKRIGGFDRKRIISSAGKIVATGTGMGAAVLAVSLLIERSADMATLPGQLAGVIVPVLVGAAVYAWLSYALRVEELRSIGALVLRRLR